MIRNYLKTAVRSLFRHRFFSAINVAGLAVSLAICLAIGMLVADQMNYDRFNTDRHRIYRINSIPQAENGVKYNETATSPLPLRGELDAEHTGFEQTVRLARGFANNWFELEQNITIPVSGYYADPEVIEFFQYELEFGDSKTALQQPFAVVLTRKAASKLFRQENPVGQTIKIGDHLYHVTGVLKQSGRKSHIAFDALASMATLSGMAAPGKGERVTEDWYNYSQGWTYVRLPESATVDGAAGELAHVIKRHYHELPRPDEQQRLSFTLQSLSDITPGPFINNPIGPFMPWVFIWFFAALAGIVLLTSCFNFTNLSIARSLTRAREIGVRKATGAMRSQVFVQFLLESVVVALCSLIIAFGLLQLIRPLLLSLHFAQLLQWDLAGDWTVYGIFVVFALVTGLLAGFFPAVIMSGFQPIKVLKGFAQMKLMSGVGLRKVLLVAQFTFSLVFILSVIVVFNQLQLFLRADHGFSMDQKAVVQLNGVKPEVLKTALSNYPEIENVAAASHLPAAGTTYGADFKRDLSEQDWTMLPYYAVDEDYLVNMKLRLVAGRFFGADLGTSNRQFIVINERAVEAFRFATNADALGQELILHDDSSRYKVLGVVRDYNHQLLMEKMDPLALRYVPGELHLLQVSYRGSFESAVAAIGKAWQHVNPNDKPDIREFSGEVHKMYDVLFGDLVSVLTVVSLLAIGISCMGLLGMATYITETRIREVSIRKVLGSSNWSIVVLLSRGFITILCLAIVLAIPLAWLLNNWWLEKLAYHVSVDFLTVLWGVLMLLTAGVLTIGSQTMRAVVIKPTEHLKSE